MQKNPRRKPEDIERNYVCTWKGCGKGYGMLKHLTTHMNIQRHGPKRAREEFEEDATQKADKNQAHDAYFSPQDVQGDSLPHLGQAYQYQAPPGVMVYAQSDHGATPVSRDLAYAVHDPHYVQAQADTLHVKCDESKPICGHCKSENRQCELPPPRSASSKKSKHVDSRDASTRSSPTDREDKGTSSGTGLEIIKNETEDKPGLPQTRPRLDSSEVSAAASTSNEKVTTPPTDTSRSQSRSQTPYSSLQTNSPPSTPISRASRWADYRADIQKYLQYHDEHITFYHYFLRFNMEDCIHTELIDLALTYEPLLYAVVAFSAYQHTLKQPDGQLTDFLTYYSQSLDLLMNSLAKNAKPTEATILTVLQLATFEQYLGDWVNLVGHHRAAHYMLLELCTPENIMETEVHRLLLAWHLRFNLVAGLMAGDETVLDRRWYVACSDWYHARLNTEDVDVDIFMQYIVAQNQLIRRDVAALFSKLAKGTVNMDEFQFENTDIMSRLQMLKSSIEGLNYGYYTVTEFTYRVPLTADDIMKPYVPGGPFRGDSCVLNFAWCDWYELSQMHKYQTSLALGIGITTDLEQISLEQCRIYDAIERFPKAPKGSSVVAHTSLAHASAFLKKDDIMWARRKLAQVERMGYVFPPTFRQRMAQLWNVPEVEHWWLPNEDGYFPILKDIRNLVEERVTMREDAAKGRQGQTPARRANQHQANAGVRMSWIGKN